MKWKPPLHPRLPLTALFNRTRPQWGNVAAKDPIVELQQVIALAKLGHADAPIQHVVIICGSRIWKDKRIIESVVRKLDPSTLVVTGGAQGADAIADDAAKEYGLAHLVVPADWEKHGKSAGPIRNEAMLKLVLDEQFAHASKEVMAFRVGLHSKGTDHMCRIARQAGVTVTVYDERGGVR